ncbi:MAG: hypothetical protein JEY79_13890 [Pseudodesulfovibrio sp.]|nr:hypothetical protein [Pseudodesulfovibrio sp.]
MKINVPVNHNYYEEAPIQELELGDSFSVRKSATKKVEQLFSPVYELKLVAAQLKQVKIINFKGKRFDPDEERLILKLYSKEKPEGDKEYFIQTGLYAGVLFHKGCKFNIAPKYGDAFLKRMLNFVNDIYVDTQKVQAKKDDAENQALFIIAYLFIHTLEKAAVLGLPQQYRNNRERSHKVKGRIDFNHYLNRDIPFQGKLTSSFRERLYVQEIIDILHLALRKLESVFGKDINGHLLGLTQLLKQEYSGRFVTHETIQKAKRHQAIQNPMYSGFKRVLEYAEIILQDKDLMPDSDHQNLSTTGYLFDISELFELYLEKLLIRKFPEWIVNGQEQIATYQKQFYHRSMFPDLVMKHRETGKVAVFDAKFKKMNFDRRDVDRSDFHQIHSYSGFYQNVLMASGLIYPLSEECNIEKAHSTSLYGSGDNEINFIIDGIYVSEGHSMKQVIENENAFLERVSNTVR